MVCNDAVLLEAALLLNKFLEFAAQRIKFETMTRFTHRNYF